MSKKTKIKDLTIATTAEGNAFKKINENTYDLIFFQKFDESEDTVTLQVTSKIRFSEDNLKDFQQSVNELMVLIEKEKEEARLKAAKKTEKIANSVS